MATILIIDDEPIVRRAVRRVLELEGYVVREAGTAAEARTVLADAAGKQIGLVILDQSMPGESGLSALPGLRALNPCPYVLFCGAPTEPTVGIAAVVEKPARPGELVSRVRELLGPHSSS